MSSARNFKCFKVTWMIENFSIYLSEKCELGSPTFKTESGEGSIRGMLNLIYPSCPGILCTLHNLQGETIKNRCVVSLLLSSGEVSMEEAINCTPRDCVPFFALDKRVCEGNIHANLPQDTLTVCCRIEQKVNEECLLSTTFNRMDFLWNIGEFNDSDPNHHTMHQQGELRLVMTLIKSREQGTNKIVVAVLPSKRGWPTFLNCELFIDGVRGRVICNNCTFPCVSPIWDIEFFSKHDSSRNLRIRLKSIIATETASLARPSPECINEDLQLFSNKECIRFVDASEAVLWYSHTLRDDLLLLYKERALSDATLNTEGRSFLAHRSILAARSSVFRTMFENEKMNKGRSGVVDIKDVDSETVERMLAFLYGDLLESVQWEEASKLYYAADKYDVQLLKQRCAEILKASLAVDNACDTLVLANAHSDEQLRKFAVDFIRDHEEVISSSDWENLEESNPRLTSKILREVYVKKGK